MRQAFRGSNAILSRLLGGVVAVLLGLLAVFLFTAFAVVAGVLALVGIGRLWWLQRRRQEREDASVIEAEYTVGDAGEGSAREPDAVLPPRFGD